MAAQRYNFFQQVHKGIRAVAHRLVEQAQRTDFGQRSEVARLEEAVEQAFAIFEEHAAKEIEFITPVLRACAPRLAAESDAEHHEQELRLRDLRQALRAAARSGDAAAGHALVVALSRFEGEMLVHMADEEERVMPALWAAFDDATLHRVHERLLASIPHPDKARAVAFMLPALSLPERRDMLAGVRASAPPEAFDRIAGLARQVLPAAEWDRLAQALAVAA